MQLFFCVNVPCCCRLAQNGKLGDIEADWDDWQLDQMLVQVRTRSQAAQAQQRSGAVTPSTGCGSRLRRGRAEVDDSTATQADEPRRVRAAHFGNVRALHGISTWLRSLCQGIVGCTRAPIYIEVVVCQPYSTAVSTCGACLWLRLCCDHPVLAPAHGTLRCAGALQACT
jgi:hypothetical protein